MASRPGRRGRRLPAHRAHRALTHVTLDLLVDVILAALVVAAAGYAIAARHTFAAVVGFVTCGLVLALVWARLGAVDVALTEAAIGSGLTGGLLIGAAARLRSAGMPPAAE